MSVKNYRRDEYVNTDRPHEYERLESDHESPSGIWGLLLVPLFLLLLGWGALNLFKNYGSNGNPSYYQQPGVGGGPGNSTTTPTTSPNYNDMYGVGGGPYVSPTTSPTPTQSWGYGGSNGTTPNDAPSTGMGGAQ